MYETRDEIRNAFPGLPSNFKEYAFNQLAYNHSIVGVVEACDFTDSYPRLIRVDSNCDKFEILGNATKFIEVPVTHEKVLKRRL